MLYHRTLRAFSSAKTNPKVFFDISIANTPKGRLVFEVHFQFLLIKK